MTPSLQCLKCGQINSVTSTACQSCGTPLGNPYGSPYGNPYAAPQTPMPPPVNPYAYPPQPMTGYPPPPPGLAPPVYGLPQAAGYGYPPMPYPALPGGGVWREFDLLVMHKGAALPDRCVKCNRPSDVRVKRNLSWLNPLWYLLILASPLIYIIVAAIVRKRATIEVGMCETHHTRRRGFLTMSWLLLAVGVIGMMVSISAHEGWIAVAGLVVIVVAAVSGTLAQAQTVLASKIDDNFIWLKNLSKEYLDQIPYYQQPWR